MMSTKPPTSYFTHQKQTAMDLTVNSPPLDLWTSETRTWAMPALPPSSNLVAISQVLDIWRIKNLIPDEPDEYTVINHNIEWLWIIGFLKVSWHPFVIRYLRFQIGEDYFKLDIPRGPRRSLAPENCARARWARSPGTNMVDSGKMLEFFSNKIMISWEISARR